MRVARVHIENFRGIRLADLRFAGTTVLLGDNNTGKSTVFEAIELAIGADRLARGQVIDEHDFFGGAYRGNDEQPAPKIVVEVVIAGLDAQHCERFRNNLEFWRESDGVLIGPGGAEHAAQPGIEPAVRIRFEGEYDQERPSHPRQSTRLDPSRRQRSCGPGTDWRAELARYDRRNSGQIVGSSRKLWAVAGSSVSSGRVVGKKISDETPS